MSFENKLTGIIEKYNSLQKKILDPSLTGSEFGKVSKEIYDLEPIAKKSEEYIKSEKNLAEAEEILLDKNADQELK